MSTKLVVATDCGVIPVGPGRQGARCPPFDTSHWQDFAPYSRPPLWTGGQKLPMVCASLHPARTWNFLICHHCAPARMGLLSITLTMTRTREREREIMRNKYNKPHRDIARALCRAGFDHAGIDTVRFLGFLWRIVSMTTRSRTFVTPSKRETMRSEQSPYECAHERSDPPHARSHAAPRSLRR